MQCCVASNRHVLVKQHVSHGNQPCFDLTTSVVFNRFQAKNQFTFGDERVALGAVEHQWRQHRFLSEYENTLSSFLPFQAL